MMAFGVLVFLDLVLRFFRGKRSRVLVALAALLGALVLCAMAGAYYQMLGEPACRTVAVLPFFAVGGLGTGAALYALFVEGPYEKGAFGWVSIVVDALLALTLVAMASHFAGVGLGPVPMIVGLVIGPVASIAVMLAAGRGAKAKGWAMVAVLVLMTVGLAIARYAFYATI